MIEKKYCSSALHFADTPCHNISDNTSRACFQFYSAFAIKECQVANCWMAGLFRLSRSRTCLVLKRSHFSRGVQHWGGPRIFLTPQLPAAYFHTVSLTPWCFRCTFQEYPRVLALTPSPEQGWIFPRVCLVVLADRGQMGGGGERS